MGFKLFVAGCDWLADNEKTLRVAKAHSFWRIIYTKRTSSRVHISTTWPCSPWRIFTSARPSIISVFTASSPKAIIPIFPCPPSLRSFPRYVHRSKPWRKQEFAHATFARGDDVLISWVVRIQCTASSMFGDGMVNVIGKGCSHDSCSRVPSFKTEGGKMSVHCKQHAEVSIVSVLRKCCSP